jgi:hypothetical protein
MLTVSPKNSSTPAASTISKLLLYNKLVIFSALERGTYQVQDSIIAKPERCKQLTEQQ